jgi:hypothetical protein
MQQIDVAAPPLRLQHDVGSERSIRPGDRAMLGLLAAAALLLRLWLLVVHRIDSDEPQHLHVAWAWTRGLVQYRDVFDNHLPLLHVLFAPVMALMPESSSVFLLMRLAIAPFAIACAWLLFVLARPQHGTRVAAAAAILFSVMPPWLSKSVEFRNDTLWIFCWLAALALLARPRPASFCAGIAFGLCLLASIKAVPLLLAHLLALATTGSITRQRIVAVGMPLLLGFALPVVLTVALFHAAGAADEMLYATLLFNAAAPIPEARRLGGAVAFVFVATGLMRVSARVGARAGNRGNALLLFALWYVSLLLAFWPILTSRDFLPLVPLAALAIAVRWRFAIAVPVLVAALASLVDARVWRRSDPTRERFVDAAVALTGKDDYVFDLKGDAVFRRRPVALVYEDVGRALIASGRIADRGPEEIAATGCCTAIRDTTHLPPRTRAFLNRHFVDLPFVDHGLLRVCGTHVRGTSFEIAVPQTYAVVAREPARVVIDGLPYRGPRALGAGRHSLASGGNDRVTVIWWRAAKESP